MKRLLVVVLSLVMVLGSITTAFAAVPVGQIKDKFEDTLMKEFTKDVSKKIETMKYLNVVSGNESGDLMLEDPLTRAQGTIIYTMLFGFGLKLVDFEKAGIYTSKFKDVPDWARAYVEFLAERNIVAGISETKFGSNDAMTAEQFTTLILRGLGYSDREGDFAWNNSLEKAIEVGLITDKERQEIEKDAKFTREEMLIISYNALFTRTKTNDLFWTVRDATERTQLAYEILTEEELKELQLAKANKDYDIFGNDKERKKILYDKFMSILNRTTKLITIYVDGELVETPKIESIKYLEFSGGTLRVEYDNQMVQRLYYDKGILYNTNDMDLAQSMYIVIIRRIAENAYNIQGTWIKVHTVDYTEFPTEVLVNATEEYKFSVRTKNDKQLLIVDAEIYKK